MTPDEICAKLASGKASADSDEVRLALLACETDSAAAARFAASLTKTAQSLLATDPRNADSVGALATRAAHLGSDFTFEAKALRVRGQALRALGSHEEAVRVFELARDAALTAGDAALAAQVQLGAIDSLGMLGSTQEALALGNALLEQLRSTGCDADAAKVLVNIANLYFRLDRYDEALSRYEDAGAILATNDADPVAIAMVDGNCANCLAHLNRIDEALSKVAAARDGFVAAGLLAAAATANANEGFLRYCAGEHTRAVALISAARAALGNLDLKLDVAKCDLDLADVYRDLNLVPEALECYTRAIAAFIELNVPYERAKALLGRARVWASMGQFDDALIDLDEAESAFSGQSNAVQRAFTRLARSQVYLMAGNRVEARVQARRAQRTLRSARLVGWAAEARFALLQMDLDQGVDRRRALARVARTAKVHGRPWLACRAEHALGTWYAASGDLTRAIKRNRNAAGILERLRDLVATEEFYTAFVRDKVGIVESLVDNLLARGRRADTLEALDHVERFKSQLLLQRVRQASLRDGQSRTSDDVAARIERLRRDLGAAYQQNEQFQEPNAQRFRSPVSTGHLKSLEDEYLAAMLAAQPGILPATAAEATAAHEFRGPGLRQIQQRLHGATLIEYFISGGTICAFVVTESKVTAARCLAEAAQVSHLARRLRFHMSRPELLGRTQPLPGFSGWAAQKAFVGVLASLHNALVAPIEHLFAGSRLIVVPYGLIHGLPMQALHDGSCYVLDRYEVTYAPSASIWLQTQLAEGKPRDRLDGNALSALLVGASVDELPFVSEEIAALSKIMTSADVLCGPTATLDAFRQLAREKRFIHLATHAQFRSDNPMFSGLRFADGWLLALDLYAVELKCDLVTLAACWTGASAVEAGDEMFGLVRGFYGAGVRALLTSLWPADDRATSMLMQRFWESVQLGNTYTQALASAQKCVRDEFGNPYYWAPFILFG